MLNHLLATTSAHSAATVTAALKSDTALATRCLDLFEDRKLIVAAKALLSLALAAPRAPYLLLFACEKSLLTRFMRIDCEGANADVKAYTQQCQAAMRAALLASAPCVLDGVCGPSAVSWQSAHPGQFAKRHVNI